MQINILSTFGPHPHLPHVSTPAPHFAQGVYLELNMNGTLHKITCGNNVYLLCNLVTIGHYSLIGRGCEKFPLHRMGWFFLNIDFLGGDSVPTHWPQPLRLPARAPVANLVIIGRLIFPSLSVSQPRPPSPPPAFPPLLSFAGGGSGGSCAPSSLLPP